MTATTTRKLLLVGWDAADWKVITPLLDAGAMPNLERFVRGGVMGNLATLYPVLSPMLWTSIATGKRAWKHGIHGFSEPDAQGRGVRPVTNLGRKTKAIWNILNQCGKRSIVVGWWPSHPAEPISGVMVSNHFQSAVAPLDKPWPLRPGSVHPRRLEPVLRELRVHPNELEPEQILPFVPRAKEVDESRDKRLSSVGKILAETASVHAVATGLMQNEPWDLMAVYYDAIDHFCHGFMQYHPPRLPWVKEDDFDLYKDVVNGAYRFHDLMLGSLMQLAGEDTTMVLVSDHGFHPDHLRPREIPNEPAGPADEHRPYGVFAMRGPGVKRDELVFGASLLDVTPTILAAFGLPLGRDMDGKPLVTAFETPPAVEYVESWDAVAGDAGTHPAEMQVDPVDSAEALNQLVALGYIDKPDENRDKAVAQTVRELRYNLARDLLDSRRYADAAAMFLELWEGDPDESRFGVHLFDCQLALGRAADAHCTFERLRAEKRRYAASAAAELEVLEPSMKSRKPEDLDEGELRRANRLRKRAATNEATLAFLGARLAAAEGRDEEALAMLEQAARVQMHNRPQVLKMRGEVLIKLKRWQEALTEFERLAKLDPVHPAAHLGRGRCLLGLRQPAPALRELLAAIGLRYHDPLAHYLCGVALRRLGRREEATAAFERALAQNPVFPDAHRALARLHRRAGNAAKANEHRRWAHEAARRIAEHRAGNPPPSVSSAMRPSDLDGAASLGAVGAVKPGPPLAPEEILIVSGLPRSGTSMMMQMLAAGGLPALTDGARAADSDNPRGYFEFEAAKKPGAADWLAQARGKSVKIVAQLLPALPRGGRYRIVFMERRLSEVLASQTAMLARLEREGSRLAPAELARAYRRQIDGVRHRLEGSGGRVPALSVDYAEAVNDPVAVATRVNAFLGGSLDTAAMAAAVAPELRRQVSA